MLRWHHTRNNTAVYAPKKVKSNIMTNVAFFTRCASFMSPLLAFHTLNPYFTTFTFRIRFFTYQTKPVFSTPFGLFLKALFSSNCTLARCFPFSENLSWRQIASNSSLAHPLPFFEGVFLHLFSFLAKSSLVSPSELRIEDLRVHLFVFTALGAVF